MKFCPNIGCSHRQRTGTPAEYDVDRPDCADCGVALVNGPAHYATPAPETAAPPRPSSSGSSSPPYWSASRAEDTTRIVRQILLGERPRARRRCHLHSGQTSNSAIVVSR